MSLYRRAALVGILILVGIVATLVDNVATSELPDSIRRYEHWAWPLVGVLSVVVIAGGVWQFISSQHAVVNTAGSPAFPRSTRDRALHNVSAFVSGRIGEIGDSVHALPVQLSERRGLTRPFDEFSVREISYVSSLSVEDRTSNLDYYKSLDCSMLLLGPVGAGKTFQLLSLAETILQDAKSDPGAPIPLVLDLAGWGESGRGPLSRLRWLFGSSASASGGPATATDPLRWLLRQIQSRYGIGESIARPWLERHQIVLILDGLDEVADGRLEDCVHWLNSLIRSLRAPPCVISCRSTYLTQAKGLRVTGAVEILPLSPGAVEAYLRESGADFVHVRKALDSDESQRSLLETPLWLHLAVQVYKQGGSPSIYEQAAEDPDRHAVLLAAYVKEIIRRRRKSNKYKSAEILHYMRYLSQAAEKTTAHAVPSSIWELENAPGGAFASESAEVMVRDFLPAAITTFIVLAIARPLGEQIEWLSIAAALLIAMPAICVSGPPVAAGVSRRTQASRAILGSALGIAVGGVAAALSLGLSDLASAFVGWSIRQAAIPFVFVFLNVRALGLLFLAMRGGAKWSWWRLGAIVLCAILFLGPESYSLGPRRAAVDAYTTTLCSVSIFVAAMGVFMLVSLSGQISRTNVVRGLIVRLGVSAATLIIAVALLPTAHLAGLGPVLAAMSGAAGGLIAAVPMALLAALLVMPALEAASGAWVGAYPWRLRAFLSYAADEGLLIRAGRSYFFEHDLIRRYYSRTGSGRISHTPGR